jgi:hypothetical protein
MLFIAPFTSTENVFISRSPDAQDIAVELDVLRPEHMHRVTLEQERQPVHRREVTHHHDLD